MLLLNLKTKTWMYQNQKLEGIESVILYKIK